MGRRPNPGTPNERAKRRREMVRANVREHRRRQKVVQALHQPCAVEDTLKEQEPEDLSEPTNTSTHLDLSGGPAQQVRICHALDGHGIRWLLQPPLRLTFAPTYSDAFIAAWRECCKMPDHLDEGDRHRVHVNVCCGSWVDSTCVSRSTLKDDLLSNALLASALIVMGETSRNADMIRRAIELESGVLEALRLTINQQQSKYKAHELPHLTMTVLTVAVANLLVRKSWLSFGLHLRGVGALIESATPQSLISQTRMDQFFAYRAVQVPFAFIERKDCFLSHPDWIHFPLRENFTVASPCLQNLIDIIFLIPSLMQAFDEAEASNTLPSSRVGFFERLHAIESDLMEWEERCDMRFPWTSSDTVSSLEPAEFNVTSRMEFSNTLVANIASFLLGAMVALCDLKAAISTRTDLTMEASERQNDTALQCAVRQTRLWSSRAVRCIHAFRVLEPLTVGKLVCLFPLDMAWRAYLNLYRNHGVVCEREILICERLAAEYELTGLPVLRKH